ncbi:MAG: flagellar hook-basal body complex protein FliE [Planctomycetota bacterium]
MSGFDYDAAASRIAREFQQVGGAGAPKTQGAEGGGKFGEVLKNLLSETDDLQHEADKAVEQLLSGEKQDVHEVMLSMAKADVSFRMMIEVRNKLVEAYQEVMRMQV